MFIYIYIYIYIACVCELIIAYISILLRIKIGNSLYFYIVTLPYFSFTLAKVYQNIIKRTPFPHTASHKKQNTVSFFFLMTNAILLLKR